MRAPLTRRSAISSGRPCRPASPDAGPSWLPLIAASLLQADVDLGDLELARGTARDLHGDGLVAFVPDQRAADRRLVGELVLVGLGLGRADDRVLDRLAGLLVLAVHHRADLDD